MVTPKTLIGIRKQSTHGFTLVELLIVIVVIAILAAITIVAYSGITARANTSKAQTNAEAAQKVAETYYVDNSYYPVTAASFNTGSATTKLPASTTVIPDAATTTATSANAANTVVYSCLTASGSLTTGQCVNATGGRIGYYNSTTKTVGYVYVGSANSSSTGWLYPTT